MRATVLIVDDEHMLLALFAEALSDRYEVLVAPCVADGIALLKQHVVHLVVTDLNCGMDNGLDLLRWIEHDRPGLLATSFVLSGDYDPDMEGFEVPVITKPINLEQLRAVFASALEAAELPQT